MKALYVDCISGIAGDMTLAALIDAGASMAYIEGQLRTLPLDPFAIKVETVNKRGITAKLLRLQIGEPVDASQHHHHHDHHHHDHHHHDHQHHDHGHHDEPHFEHHGHEHRKASSIIRMIEESGLPERVKRRSIGIFETIAAAESKIHGICPEEVHFHEVGAMDSIVDTIGVCLALEALGVEEIYASPVPTGHGRTRMAHGLYPIPAPATAEMLKDIPLVSLECSEELATPTGVGILKALAKKFGSPPTGTIKKIGYGAGNKDLAHPNVLRVLLMELNHAVNESEEIFVVEAQLDDITGEALGYAMERLFEAGALDVFYTPIYMKKNRPGTLVTLLTPERFLQRCEETLLLETTTLGVRRSRWMRQILDRSVSTVSTPFGPIRMKQALRGDQFIRAVPEYEDVAEAARRSGVPFRTVYQRALTMSDS